MAEKLTGIDQDNETAVVLVIWQRYQPMLEMAVTQLISLSMEESKYLARATFLLESLSPAPGLRLATRLHAIDLGRIPRYGEQLVSGISLEDGAVLAGVQKLLAAVPEKDRVNFWLALAALWVKSVPSKIQVLEGEGIDSPALLEDEPRFREYLRSELMQRLTHMY